MGKLSFSWPASPTQATVNKGDLTYAPLLPYGYGLNYQSAEASHLLTSLLDETVMASADDAQKEVFFDGKMHKPWLMWLMSGDELLEPECQHSSAR